MRKHQGWGVIIEDINDLVGLSGDGEGGEYNDGGDNDDDDNDNDMKEDNNNLDSIILHKILSKIKNERHDTITRLMLQLLK